jgi:hypothetical protein
MLEMQGPGTKSMSLSVYIMAFVLFATIGSMAFGPEWRADPVRRMALVIILIAIGFLGVGMVWSADQGRQPCGPNRHWVYIRTGIDLDLSCERDRD